MTVRIASLAKAVDETGIDQFLEWERGNRMRPPRGCVRSSVGTMVIGNVNALRDSPTKLTAKHTPDSVRLARFTEPPPAPSIAATSLVAWRLLFGSWISSLNVNISWSRATLARLDTPQGPKDHGVRRLVAPVRIRSCGSRLAPSWSSRRSVERSRI
jgi:hypothetical protein